MCVATIAATGALQFEMKATGMSFLRFAIVIVSLIPAVTTFIKERRARRKGTPL